MKFGQFIEFKKKIFFFFNNHAQHMVEKLFSDPFLESQDRAYVWISSLKFYAVGVFLFTKLWAIEIY